MIVYRLLLVYGQSKSIYNNIYYDLNARIDAVSVFRVWLKWACKVVIFIYGVLKISVTGTRKRLMARKSINQWLWPSEAKSGLADVRDFDKITQIAVKLEHMYDTSPEQRARDKTSELKQSVVPQTIGQ